MFLNARLIPETIRKTHGWHPVMDFLKYEEFLKKSKCFEKEINNNLLYKESNFLDNIKKTYKNCNYFNKIDKTLEEKYDQNKIYKTLEPPVI